MSTLSIRHDDSTIKTNIMTTTAAQARGQHAGVEDGRTSKVDKKSPEYLLKSGLAGGFAGCAVSV